MYILYVVYIIIIIETLCEGLVHKTIPFKASSPITVADSKKNKTRTMDSMIFKYRLISIHHIHVHRTPILLYKK